MKKKIIGLNMEITLKKSNYKKQEFYLKKKCLTPHAQGNVLKFENFLQYYNMYFSVRGEMRKNSYLTLIAIIHNFYN